MAKIGQKTITVKTTGKEKIRIACLLSISADGEKLKPFIIFKGKKRGIINKELDEFINIKKYEIITKTQTNSWMDEELFIEYIESVIVNYKYGKKKLLILVYCPAHCTENVKKQLKHLNIDFIFIPKNMTSVLQPLDRMINNPFKKYLKTQYSEFLMFENKKDESISDTRERILNDINEIWYANTKEFSGINKDNIIKSFNITGISNELDGSEDHIFDGYDIINKLNIIKEPKTNSDSDSSYDSQGENEKKKLLLLSQLNNKDNKNDNSPSSNSLKEKFMDNNEISEVEKENSMIINESKDMGKMIIKNFLIKMKLKKI